jgi:Glycosyltransferases involved in cell wall biogenesis
MMVSAILPTRARRDLAALAVESFLSQTYPDKELVVLDDKADPSFPQGIAHPLIRYQLHEKRLSIGQKRNALCHLAKGELICHFDSDDWSHPGRIAHQLKLLLDSGKALCAYHSILFYGYGDRVTRYPGKPGVNLGSSYLYKKQWWATHPFSEKDRPAEDWAFIKAALEEKELVSVDGTDYLVARIHEGNTCKKSPGGFQPQPRTALPEGFPA